MVCAYHILCMCNRAYTLHKGYTILKPDTVYVCGCNHHTFKLGKYKMLQVLHSLQSCPFQPQPSILGYAMHLQPWTTCMLMAIILSFERSELLAIFVGSEPYKGSIHPAHWLVSTFVSPFLSQESSSKEAFRHESNRALYVHIPIISSILLLRIVQRPIFNTSNEAFMETMLAYVFAPVREVWFTTMWRAKIWC